MQTLRPSKESKLMAALAEHATASTAKMLLISNNGGGKTGSLASLAKAGYNLRIADTDNGTEILFHLLKDDPAALARVDVESCIDKYSEQGGALRPTAPLVGFSKLAKTLTNWPGLGKPSTWTSQDILVLDTLTGAGRSIMNHTLSLAGKLATGQQPSQPDWGHAMSLQENLLAGLYSLPCHVIVCAHVVSIQPEGSPTSEGFPSALGNKLPQKVGSYFNSTLALKFKGVGQAKTRVLLTKDPTLGCKTPAPGKVKDEYSLETGLADYFKDLFGPLKGA